MRAFRYLVLLAVTVAIQAAGMRSGGQVSTKRVSISITGGSFACQVVTVDIKHGGLQPRIVCAKAGIGRTESFASMLQRSHAVCGINGSFFEAYNQTGDKDPAMTLISGGSVVHKGSTGSVCGFSANGDVVMGRLELPIRGTVTAPGHKSAHWFAYWMNRTPTAADNIALFTPARGERTRVPDGISVVVRGVAVDRVVRGDTEVPKDGYVINFRGSSEAQAELFAPGSIVNYTIERKAERNEEQWQGVQEAVGAGPMLVTDGAVSYQPEAEGFSSPKILSMGGRRSAIGVTAEGKVLLVSAAGPTVAQLAQIMLKLGAVHAMNLDGGASSGLYCSGSMLCTPGRELSNALVFVKKQH